MKCSRLWCKNIECDTHIGGIGCICSDCESEFKEKFSSEEEFEHEDIWSQLHAFMETSKGKGLGKIDINTFFKDYINHLD